MLALAHRQPAGGLHHSDQGVQYASAAYRALLAEAGIEVSMSRRGEAGDRERRHSALGYRSPVAYELEVLAAL